MQKKTMALIAGAALLVFAYGAALPAMTADPATWIRPALALVAGLFLVPGVFAAGAIYALAGIDVATAEDWSMHVVAISVLFWLAAAFVARKRGWLQPVRLGGAVVGFEKIDLV